MVSNATTSHARIEAADTHERIIEALRECGLTAIAVRLAYLKSPDHDDPEEQPMDLESLRGAASLLVEHPEWPKPGIGVGPDGLVGIEWDIDPTGLLAMLFQPSGLISFAATSGPRALGPDRPSVSGTGAADDAVAALASFTGHLRTR